MTAPNFCMLLRKHLQNGRIVNISQPGWNVLCILTLNIWMRWAICVTRHWSWS